MADPFIGEIRAFAGNFAPLDWAFCDGSLMQISQYLALFQLIGTTYGGDGQNTFALPDLRGRAVIHQGASTGQNYVIGQALGVENVTLITPQMPGHPHSFSATTAAGNTPTPGPATVLASTPGGFPIYDGTAAPVALSGHAVTNAGQSIPHNNRQPYLAISYIISLFGIFPSQN